MRQRYKNVEANPHSDLDLKKLETLSGDYTWLTEEGPVVIDVRGDSVLITESLDQPTTEHGANRLAIVGLSALTCAPISSESRVQLSLIGGAGRGDRFSLAWRHRGPGRVTSAIAA